VIIVRAEASVELVRGSNEGEIGDGEMNCTPDVRQRN